MKKLSTKTSWAGAAAVVVCAMLVTATSTWAGATPNPVIRVGEIVRARSVDQYTIWFRGGEPARILVNGDGDTDLDLYVYDEFGKLITKDDDYTDTCVVQWLPSWTGCYTVRIVNRGYVGNVYDLVTN